MERDEHEHEIARTKSMMVSGDTLEGLLKREHAPLHASILALADSQRDTNKAVSDMATALARGEQKFDQIHQHQIQQDNRLDHHADKLDKVEDISAVNSNTFSLFRWIAGGAIAALVAVFGYFDSKFDEILDQRGELIEMEVKSFERLSLALDKFAENMDK